MSTQMLSFEGAQSLIDRICALEEQKAFANQCIEKLEGHRAEAAKELVDARTQLVASRELAETRDIEHQKEREGLIQEHSVRPDWEGFEEAALPTSATPILTPIDDLVNDTLGSLLRLYPSLSRLEDGEQLITSVENL
ncbi:hypothetical protein AAF712_007981 [Marasmius tenuissimus]|uniref:Uncharacterized protein n=1 Tax=Marasmius tenuissimus TaxID=585030 RepID=A0ABR2ZUJ3_9AGAR